MCSKKTSFSTQSQTCRLNDCRKTGAAKPASRATSQPWLRNPVREIGKKFAQHESEQRQSTLAAPFAQLPSGTPYRRLGVPNCSSTRGKPRNTKGFMSNSQPLWTVHPTFPRGKVGSAICPRGRIALKVHKKKPQP